MRNGSFLIVSTEKKLLINNVSILALTLVLTVHLHLKYNFFIERNLNLQLTIHVNVINSREKYNANCLFYVSNRRAIILNCNWSNLIKILNGYYAFVDICNGRVLRVTVSRRIAGCETPTAAGASRDVSDGNQKTTGQNHLVHHQHRA